MASDESFLLFREFRYLKVRVLLNLQDEIARMEADLDSFDEVDSINDPHALMSRESDEANNPRRKILLSEIQQKVNEYGDSCPVVV